ncbi:MAG TPA: VOC family protein [Alphaproteobacteria bacterium]|nr:VOC family protein [Alphaproteobacteria bacterium]
MGPWISLVTLGVRDLKNARAFYEEGLDWAPSGASNADIVYFRLGALVLALHPRRVLAAEAGLGDYGRGFDGVTLSHYVASRGAVDDALRQAAGAGGTILKSGREMPWGGYSGHLADPDGHVWEIAWNPNFRLKRDGRLLLPK